MGSCSRVGTRSLTLCGLATALIAVAPASRAVEPLNLMRIAGWWCAEPVYAGETSRVCLHFLDDQGKPTARISLLGIRGHDAPIGTVTFADNTLDMQPY